MTPEQFDLALDQLSWKGTDFCHRTGLVPNTVWRWRKGLGPIPKWADEYLRAMLAIQRLQVEFVAVQRTAGQSVPTEPDAGPDVEGLSAASVAPEVASDDR